MRSQPLRILALIAGAFIHQSAAASFYCDLINNEYTCDVVISNNNEFSFDHTKNLPQCTRDKRYCAYELVAYSDRWLISITNNGAQCVATCAPILQYCDESGCKPYCSVDAC